MWIKNKVTGKKQKVTDQQLKAIQDNEMTADLYEYGGSDENEPDEVSKLKRNDEAPKELEKETTAKEVTTKPGGRR